MAKSIPVCASPSRRLNSRYRRKPWDLPWGLSPVPLLVQAHRCCCDEPSRPGDLPSVASPHNKDG